MKKVVLFSIAVLMSVASFAQEKGDMYLSCSFSTDFGGAKTSTSLDGYESSVKEPFGTSSEISAEYAYFAANNTRLALEVAFPFSSTPFYEVDGEWIKGKNRALCICPNFSYYVKLADRFYYTPEIGALIEWSTIKTKHPQVPTEYLSSSLWGGYISLLSFEFRVSERFAIGIAGGGIGFYSSNSAYKGEDVSYRMNQFVCDLNKGSMQFIWYF